MNNTYNIFNDRKEEVDLYLKKLKLMDFNINNINEINEINEIYDVNFFKILKSGFILALYNLVEATISNAILDIYKKISSKSYKYNDIIPQIREIWISNKLNIVNSNKLKSQIIDKIINDNIYMDEKYLSISGNLDAKQIRTICHKHNINISHQKCDNLLMVKNKRNALAHGTESFTNASRDFTISQLEEIYNEIINFMNSILKDIENYYYEESFLLKK